MRRGYHLTLPASQREIVERNGFIRIASHAKRTVACSTEQLAQLNNRCKEMIGQILMSTERELTKLQDSIRQRLHVIFAVGESIRTCHSRLICKARSEFDHVAKSMQ